MEVEDIISDPSEERLETCTKDQLVAVAEHYGVELSSQVKRSKPSILTVIKAFLIERSILITKPGDPSSPGISLLTSEARLKEMDIELELKKLEFQREQADREREDRLREQEREDKQREREREDKQRECKREDRQREHERQFELRKLELESGDSPHSTPVSLSGWCHPSRSGR